MGAQNALFGQQRRAQRLAQAESNLTLGKHTPPTHPLSPLSTASNSAPIIHTHTHTTQVKAEIDAHRWLRHPCVPPLRDVVVLPDRVHLVFPHAGQAIWASIDPAAVTVDAAYHNQLLAGKMARTGLEVLQLLANKGYAYNDLKPAQFVVDDLLFGGAEEGRCSLVDFGSAAPVGGQAEQMVTLSFAPPELHADFARGAVDAAPFFGEAYDVFALGLSVFAVASGGCHPWDCSRAGVEPPPYANSEAMAKGWNPWCGALWSVALALP